MFSKGKGWFGGGWGSKPKNLHSLEQLKYLYNVMVRNENVSENNKTLLVETLRSIAEILIWGDQNDSTVFDFFLEKNMLSFFLKIMKQKCGSYVCVQLLQTLNILFENIRNETSLYYLLSNNHVNSIIVHKFDFSDEEVMAYYISFIKTLSLKLNGHTIHFFFNEHTNDFPLYTEAIKFFNHNEKMVRIAVRTLTLNVFRVDEKSMLKFIGDRTAVPYFSNLVWFIGNHVLEIDACLHAPKNYTQQMVIKLDDLVAEHLDHLHYLNDILLLNIDDLNQVLSDHLINRLLIPLYIYSLTLTEESTKITSNSQKRPRISKIISLFLLSQVFLIVNYEPLVDRLVQIILNSNMAIFDAPEFAAPPETLEESLIQVARATANVSINEDDGTVVHVEHVGANESSSSADCDESAKEDGQQVVDNPNDNCDPHMDEVNLTSMTDEQKVAAVASRADRVGLNEERPFLDALFQALDCTNKNDDHTFIFALCLIYAMAHNKGVNVTSLGDLVVRAEDAMDTNGNDIVLNSTKLLDHLIRIMHLACQYNSRVRLVTLDMTILLLKKLVMRDDKSILSDHHLASIEQAKEESALILRNFYKSEEEAIFLDLFEEEYDEMSRRKLNVEYLMMDANLLLPPSQLTSLMMNGLDYTRRLPCADVERTRYAIRVFFLLRQLSLVLRGEQETQLPLASNESLVKLEEVLDLNHSDLIACTVIAKDAPRTRRFMVIDSQQLILIEPDIHKLGWGVAKFVGLLQNVEVTVDKGDTRSLHFTIRQPVGSPGPRRIALSAKFVFDDHIRCMAANQRLHKRSTKARQRKMHQIAKLIDFDLSSHLPSASKRSSSSNALSATRLDNMPKSQSQEQLAKRASHHRPLERLRRGPAGNTLQGPGSAVPESQAARQNGSLRTGVKKVHRRRSSSTAVASATVAALSRDASPRPTASNSGVDTSDEMIPLEDLSPAGSPKSDRRRLRSRSEQRTDKNGIAPQHQSEEV